jgi:hypothetical protein
MYISHFTLYFLFICYLPLFFYLEVTVCDMCSVGSCQLTVNKYTSSVCQLR